MNPAAIPLWIRWSLTAAASVIGFCTVLSGEAQATCVRKTPGPLFANIPRLTDTLAARLLDDQDGPTPTLVGLWKTEFLLGEGPDLIDESFQQFHRDGTEMMLSRGLPPSLGNVCVGIWKETAGGGYKLRHMAWNWDADGRYISTFVMEVTITLDRRGDRFTGTWSSDNLHPVTGEPIPGEHFEGIVRGTRIRVD